MAARDSQRVSVLILQDREKRNLKDIHRHVKAAKKCIEWAGKILDRYDVSPAENCSMTCVCVCAHAAHTHTESVHLVYGTIW